MSSKLHRFMAAGLMSVAAVAGFGSQAAAQSATSGEGASIARDARESAPAALMGVWRADVAASTYIGAPPQDHFRIFQYTGEGRIMVSFMTLFADGRVSSGHWAAELDGAPGLEYFSSNGMTPYAVIHLKQRDPNTFELTNSHYGAVASTGVYRLSEDGNTLTLERNPGSETSTQIVYRRWSSR
jgi:hypothetical protein